MTKPQSITFRKLAAQDIPLLFHWLNEPHMRSFYQPIPISLEEVNQKYLPRIEGRVPTFSHIAILDGKPFGKIQSYLVSSYPEYAAEIGVNTGFSIDLFIGEASLLGKGFGKQMLGEYLRAIAFPLFPQESSCYICHEKENLPALRCAKSVGFSFLKEVHEEGKLCELLEYRK